MTISSTTNKVRTQGNGSLTDFSFTFKAFSQSDLKVYLVDSDGVATLQTITTHYTVALNSGSPGGTVTMVTAPAADEEILILRQVELTQPTDIPNVGSLREDQLEQVYDRIVMQIQQLQEQIDRAIVQSVASQDSFDLPAAVANKYLGWNSAGDAIENKDAGETGPTGATGAQGPAGIDGGAVEVTLTDGATPALDASLGNAFILTAAGDRTIAVPSNASAGKRIIIRHTASGAARTLSLATGTGGFRFGSDITALTQTESGKTDYIGCIYNSVDDKWDVVAYKKGF